MSKAFKNILIFLAIATIAVLVYVFFFSKGEAPAPVSGTGSSLSSSANPGVPVSGIVQETPESIANASKIGQEFVSQLLNLKAIKLNDEVFSSLSFQSLEDFTIILVQPGNEGRPNPFAPFGIESMGPSTATTTDTFIPINNLPGDQTLGGNGS